MNPEFSEIISGLYRTGNAPKDSSVTFITPISYHTYGGDPMAKDVYVEIDWMTNHVFGRWEQTEALQSFSREDISLRLDDGCYNGGSWLGTHIWSKSYDSIKNDYHNNNNYFSSYRVSIFHQCIIAHLDENNDILELGQGNAPGDFFVLWEGSINGDSERLEVFLHELGHNIIGNYNPSAPLVRPSNGDASHLICTDEDGIGEHCNKKNSLGFASCVLCTYTLNSPSDYCSDCFNAMKLYYSWGVLDNES